MDSVLPISQVTNRVQGVIHARVLKIWQAIDTKNNNVWGMNFVLLDKEGGAIQGVMPINFYRRMEVEFVEGNICEIGRFTVEHIKNSGFRTVKHDFTLYFSGQTYVTPLDPNLHDIPVCYFDFKCLEDIGTKITDEKQPIDVIGRVSHFTTIEEKMANGKPTKMQTVYMTNESGHTVEITLWAHFVDQLDIDGVYAKSNNQPMFLACSSVMLKHYQGKYSLRAYAATRFYTDRGIKEIKEYLESYKILWQVEDDTGEAEFSAIGNTAQYMIGEKASEVKDNSNLDCNELPPPLKKLIGKKYKFTISGKLQVLYKNHRAYNIIRSELIIGNEQLALPAITKDGEDKTSEIEKKMSAFEEDDMPTSNDLKDNSSGANKTLLKEIKQEFKTPKKKIVSPQKSQTPVTSIVKKNDPKQKR
ncbi:hypothetical protein LUZ63_005435 [Rhynchospora breviuscula]|uniref:Replication protein A 70 kDa DNA-binding subunit B/D first OB fold domain-containing protein n=1 Tax=Rhynchospora breviuscula TaxID=2022672 RepID=A0A9Q0CMV8_9POAL|nr:hypothetical protein LUZ63_024038 [Rhynchospora breviuscula]KAJ1696923.1 hypothetical protein LUZ63_005435 [Rhynchospora breviuscula]